LLVSNTPMNATATILFKMVVQQLQTAMLNVP
jgi:hypothetical protein